MERYKGYWWFVEKGKKKEKNEFFFLETEKVIYIFSFK